MAWNMEQSGRKNTLVGPLQHTSHFCAPDRVITQDMVGANSLQRLTVSIVTGIKAHLSHMPHFYSSPLLGAKSVTQQFCLTTATGTLGVYQPLNWAWSAWVCK